MKYEMLTVKLMPDAMADIEAYAQAHFPIQCPKCHGKTTITLNKKKRNEEEIVCPRCDGTGHAGNRSDAVRYLIQFALGQQASPQAVAVASVYNNFAPRFIGEMTRMTHRIEAEMRDAFVSAIDTMIEEISEEG